MQCKCDVDGRTFSTFKRYALGSFADKEGKHRLTSILGGHGHDVEVVLEEVLLRDAGQQLWLGEGRRDDQLLLVLLFLVLLQGVVVVVVLLDGHVCVVVGLDGGGRKADE